MTRSLPRNIVLRVKEKACEPKMAGGRSRRLHRGEVNTPDPVAAVATASVPPAPVPPAPVAPVQRRQRRVVNHPNRHMNARSTRPYNHLDRVDIENQARLERRTLQTMQKRFERICKRTGGVAVILYISEFTAT